MYSEITKWQTVVQPKLKSELMMLFLWLSASLLIFLALNRTYVILDDHFYSVQMPGRSLDLFLTITPILLSIFLLSTFAVSSSSVTFPPISLVHRTLSLQLMHDNYLTFDVNSLIVFLG